MMKPSNVTDNVIAGFRTFKEARPVRRLVILCSAIVAILGAGYALDNACKNTSQKVKKVMRPQETPSTQVQTENKMFIPPREQIQEPTPSKVYSFTEEEAKRIEEILKSN